MDPYKELANGIVLRAVLDYKAALRRLNRGKNVLQAMKEVTELESFFRSDWFKALSDTDGEETIQQLRRGKK